MPRRRSRPQLDWPVHYKYRAPVSLFVISAVAVRAISAQATAVWCASFWERWESGALASGWDHLFSLVSILLLGAFSLSWLLIAAKILFLVKVKVLGGWLKACGWVTRVSSMVKRAQSSIF
jgi:hypothetical protein